jgi:hypothetical protein
VIIRHSLSAADARLTHLIPGGEDGLGVSVGVGVPLADCDGVWLLVSVADGLGVLKEVPVPVGVVVRLHDPLGDAVGLGEIYAEMS